MAKSYTGTTRTLILGNTAYRDIIFLPNKPPLDAELNFISDIASNLIVQSNAAVRNSGFFNTQGLETIGLDNTGEAFGINATLQPNLVIFKNPLGVPALAQILGDLIQVGATNCADASQLHVTLPAAPGSGAREDLVFLEVWYQQLVSQSSVGEPVAGQCYTYGNTQYGGSIVTNDDMYYAPIGIPTTNRVQIQYAVRVVPGVNFVGYPDGINDNSTVFGQASAISPTSYTYSLSPTDSGAYIAGDGSVSAQSALGTVDGFVYAIPLMRVHRRNAAPYSLLNQNGSAKNLSQANPLLQFGGSDRPDGLFYDQIAVQDIEDLRHVLTEEGPQQLLEEAMNQLMEGKLNTLLMESQTTAGPVFNGQGLEVDTFAATSTPGTALILGPNDERRVISDATTTQITVADINVNQKTMGPIGGNWHVCDQFYITLSGSDPAGTSFNGLPTVYANIQSGAVQIQTIVPSNTTLEGTTAVVTLTSIPSGLMAQDLWVVYGIQYPAGNGLSFVPIEMEQVFETRNNRQFSFCSENSLNGIRPMSLVTSASATDFLIGREQAQVSGYGKEAFTTLGYYSTPGNGSQLINVPNTFGSNATAVNFVHGVYINGVLITRTSNIVWVVSISKSLSSFTIVFNTPIANTSTVVVYLGLLSDAVAIQENTKSLVEMARSELLTVTIPAGQNGGAGLTTITMQAPGAGNQLADKGFGGVIYGTQSEMTSSTTFQDVCFVNQGLGNNQIPCTITYNANFVQIVLSTPVGAGTTDTVGVVVTHALALDPNQNLQMSYTYRPYDGVTALCFFWKRTRRSSHDESYCQGPRLLGSHFRNERGQYFRTFAICSFDA